MKELQIPPHPTHDYSCAKCKHYYGSENRRVVMDGAHQGKNVSDLIRQGIDLQFATVATIGPCTRFPSWITVAVNHWCAEYESKDRGPLHNL